MYPTAEVINARLLSVAAPFMGVSEKDASQKLQDKVMLPVRKSAKRMELVMAYQHVKCVVSHMGISLTSVSVSTFVKHIHALKVMGTWNSPSAASTRRVLTLSPGECTKLLAGNSFIIDACARMAKIEALAKVIGELEGTASMIAWMEPNKTSRVIRCLYGHLATVCFRISFLHYSCALCCPLCVWLVLGRRLFRLLTTCCISRPTFARLLRGLPGPH
eukprot:TRINITY_DN3102_c0_g1_i2.p1 TRINITY_DN3102_c0_g1~~TRINITY_DN3102_c0_g1_i2.p1  ORF type:complete len:218 (+),score=14.64 TRINITY_DN3102_c0_g1_i2:125-778(+)